MFKKKILHNVVVAIAILSISLLTRCGSQPYSYSYSSSLDSVLQEPTSSEPKIDTLSILEQASKMNLNDLADYYRQNRYIFLRDAIAITITNLDCSISELDKMESLFSFDDFLCKRIKSIKETALRTAYRNTCDSLLCNLENAISNEIAEYLEFYINNCFIDSILEDDLPEDSIAVCRKIDGMLYNVKKSINDIIYKSCTEFTEMEYDCRKKFYSEYNLILFSEKFDAKYNHNTYSNFSYPAFVLLSKIENKTDWVSWLLWGAGIGSAFIPYAGLVISAIIDEVSYEYDMTAEEEKDRVMKECVTAGCMKIFADLLSYGESNLSYTISSLRNNYTEL